MVCIWHKLKLDLSLIPIWRCRSYNFLDRNTPEDRTEAPITIYEVIETLNQLAMYLGKKDFKKNFWDKEPYLKLM